MFVLVEGKDTWERPNRFVVDNGEVPPPPAAFLPFAMVARVEPYDGVCWRARWIDFSGLRNTNERLLVRRVILDQATAECEAHAVDKLLRKAQINAARLEWHAGEPKIWLGRARLPDPPRHEAHRIAGVFSAEITVEPLGWRL